MHVPDKWKLEDPQLIRDFITQNSFAALVSPSLEASHVPLVYCAKTHSLYGHLARTNSHKNADEGSQVLAIFIGPHHYISPNWYANQPAVPTWNYVSVHIHGNIYWLDDARTMESVEKLVRKYQPELLDNEHVMPTSYQQKLAKGIVGFRIDIKEIQAKAKLGQHRKVEDQLGVVAGLQQESSPEAAQLLSIMETLQLGLGK